MGTRYVIIIKITGITECWNNGITEYRKKQKTMKKLLLSTLLVLYAVGMSAQGVDFLPEGTTWQQAVDKAKQQGKMLFVDCYTQWCGPCKKMAREVFPQATVGQALNPIHVALKIDMEKGEGPQLLKRWQVSAFPTFIIFNGDGKEVGRFLGGSNADDFIQKVKANSQDNGSSDMDARFAAGERGEKFLLEYLGTLNAAYKRDQCNLVAEALLEGKEDTFVDDEQLRGVFMRHLTNPFCKAFVAVAHNPAKLRAAVGEQMADMKISRTLSNYGATLIDQRDGTATIDEQKFEAWQKLMAECGTDKENIDMMRLRTLITYAEKKKDYPLYMKYLNEYWGKYDVTDLDLAKWAKPVAEDCTDESSRLDMAKLLQQRVDDLHSGKRAAQTKAGNMRLSGGLDKAMEMLIGVLKGEIQNPK